VQEEVSGTDGADEEVYAFVCMCRGVFVCVCVCVCVSAINLTLSPLPLVFSLLGNWRWDLQRWVWSG